MFVYIISLNLIWSLCIQPSQLLLNKVNQTLKGKRRGRKWMTTGSMR